MQTRPKRSSPRKYRFLPESTHFLTIYIPFITDGQNYHPNNHHNLRRGQQSRKICGVGVGGGWTIFPFSKNCLLFQFNLSVWTFTPFFGTWSSIYRNDQRSRKMYGVGWDRPFFFIVKWCFQRSSSISVQFISMNFHTIFGTWNSCGSAKQFFGG
jgi:hypothetical protein